MIYTTKGAFTPEELQRQHGAARQHDRKVVPDRKTVLCPFKIAKNAYKTACNSECVFHTDIGCVFARTDAKPQKKSGFCPLAGRCQELCAMYDDGCKLAEMVKGLKPGKE